MRTEIISPRASIYDRHPGLKEAIEIAHPETVLFIPDGNGRWAQKHGVSVTEGHRKGIQVMMDFLPVFLELPSRNFLPWVFSHDNWSRPKEEIDGFMGAVQFAAETSPQFFIDNEVGFIRVGREDLIQRYYPDLWDALCKLEDVTKGYNTKTVAALIDYSGRDQQVRMLQRFYERVRSGEIPPDFQVTEEFEEGLRDGGGRVKPADLIIRTSGEQRISDLGWLARNAEFYTTPTLLPDSTEKDIVDAFIDYSTRIRNFGGRPT